MTQRASTTVEILEVDGQDFSHAADVGSRVKRLRVESHWNYSDTLVVLKRGKRSWTVSAEELRKAIDNATNVRRF